MSAMFKEELSWKVLEPMFLKIYRESLTQYEVDGMVDFYKSDAGKALALKMPLIMQKTMQSMQERMMVMVIRWYVRGCVCLSPPSLATSLAKTEDSSTGVCSRQPRVLCVS